MSIMSILPPFHKDRENLKRFCGDLEQLMTTHIDTTGFESMISNRYKKRPLPKPFTSSSFKKVNELNLNDELEENKNDHPDKVFKTSRNLFSNKQLTYNIKNFLNSNRYKKKSEKKPL